MIIRWCEEKEGEGPYTEDHSCGKDDAEGEHHQEDVNPQYRILCCQLSAKYSTLNCVEPVLLPPRFPRSYPSIYEQQEPTIGS